ncbi:MAG: hypothetical protein BGO29_10360 [Bacteroidales bacterium 36-12]|nr:MAG: hypothetical protein BGO29_10360 [Bacteroidales bacterium 36-12]
MCKQSISYIKLSLYYSLFILIFTSCQTVKWQVVDSKSVAIPINNSTENTADINMKKFIQPFKEQLEKEMNVVIGYTDKDMKVRAPESLMSNFSADVYLNVAQDKIQEHVDFSIVNIKGLRAPIPAGNITVSQIFELMPFENELVLLWIKGEELINLFDFFASIGGEGVAGMKMGIQNGKAVDVLIGGKSLVKDKVYIVATNDYLSEGNDGMIQLKNSIKRLNTGVKVRDMLIDYIQNETKQGKSISSELDGRIYIKK